MSRFGLKNITESTANIFFMAGGRTGLILVLLLFWTPKTAVIGLLALASAMTCAFVTTGSGKPIYDHGHYIYNPLLVGLALGFQFEITPASILLVIIAGILTFFLTSFLAQNFYDHLHLPVLSLPFVVVTLTLYIAVWNYESLVWTGKVTTSAWLDPNGLPFWISGYLKSLGSILFTPHIAVGVVIGLLLIQYSRILFLLSLFGYFAGTAVRGLLIGSIPAAAVDFNNFNFILTAMAVGGVFLVPSYKSYLAAGTAVFACAIVLDSLGTLGAGWGLPVLTLPFLIVTWTWVYTLRLFDHPSVPAKTGRTPEETSENTVLGRLRFRHDDRSISPPFSGEWTVWQGMDGEWTHQGQWRYALDFIITGESGQSHQGAGSITTDYPAFGKPVLAPCEGRVVTVIDGLPDNPIGWVDEKHRWGNLVILQSIEGWFVEISHFAEGSIQVREGQWVKTGRPLGFCGNSGYSSQPHIHLQVQATADIGGATLPFTLRNYNDQNGFHKTGIPQKGDSLGPVFPDPGLTRRMEFHPGDQMGFDVLSDGEIVGRLKLTVGRTEDGTLFFESPRGRLYFGVHNGFFTIYRLEGDDPWLGRIFCALPSLSLTRWNGLDWIDYVPARLAATTWRRWLAGLFGIFSPDSAIVPVKMKYQGRIIESRAVSKVIGLDVRTQIELGDGPLFSRLIGAGFELRRSEPACRMPRPGCLNPVISTETEGIGRKVPNMVDSFAGRELSHPGSNT